MSELEEVKKSLHGLENEMSGIRPVVDDIHQYMPRISAALETLAAVTVKLESNAEDHKRIHYRITDAENDHKQLQTEHKQLEAKVDTLWKEHVECQAELAAGKKTLGVPGPAIQQPAKPLLRRIQEKVAENVATTVVMIVLAFLGWLLIFHLPNYPPTKDIIERGQLYGRGNKSKD